MASTGSDFPFTCIDTGRICTVVISLFLLPHWADFNLDQITTTFPWVPSWCSPQISFCLLSSVWRLKKNCRPIGLCLMSFYATYRYEIQVRVFIFWHHLGDLHNSRGSWSRNVQTSLLRRHELPTKGVFFCHSLPLYCGRKSFTSAIPKLCPAGYFKMLLFLSIYVYYSFKRLLSC